MTKKRKLRKSSQTRKKVPLSPHRRYFRVNKDLETELGRHQIKAELLAADEINDLMHEAQDMGHDAILVEFKYPLYNDKAKQSRIQEALLAYVRAHGYNRVILTIPHYCVRSIEEDPNCDLYIDQFSAGIAAYFKKHRVKTEYIGVTYRRKRIPRIMRREADMNRPQGRYQPMRNLLREVLYRDTDRKTILFDIHSFPSKSFKEAPDTDIVLLQRFKPAKQ